jgi:hypothetical protein
MKRYQLVPIILVQCAIFVAIVWNSHVADQNNYHSPTKNGYGTLPPPSEKSRVLEPKLRSSSFSSSPSFELAKRQSFGFFETIPDEDWKRAQRIHARMFPNYYQGHPLTQNSNRMEDRPEISRLRRSHLWFGDNFQEEFHCGFAQRIHTSNEADGPKWVCDPHRIAKKVARGEDCLVYSVGSNGKVEFEKGIKEEISSACEIHTFDPMIRNKRNGNFKVALKDYATFHMWGIHTAEREEGYKNGTVYRHFKTLQSTLKELGHLNRTIDIFKIDCEWCEWEIYEQFLQADIRQILVEIHNAPMPEAQRFFETLHDAGYVIFNKEPNYENGGDCIEYAFVKLSTDFFLEGATYKEFHQRKTKPETTVLA